MHKYLTIWLWAPIPSVYSSKPSYSLLTQSHLSLYFSSYPVCLSCMHTWSSTNCSWFFGLRFSFSLSKQKVFQTWTSPELLQCSMIGSCLDLDLKIEGAALGGWLAHLPGSSGSIPGTPDPLCVVYSMCGEPESQVRFGPHISWLWALFFTCGEPAWLHWTWCRHMLSAGRLIKCLSYWVILDYHFFYRAKGLSLFFFYFYFFSPSGNITPAIFCHRTVGTNRQGDDAHHVITDR